MDLILEPAFEPGKTGSWTRSAAYKWNLFQFVSEHHREEAKPIIQ